MNDINSLSDSELEDQVEKLYYSFQRKGYKFDVFIKSFLEKIGLENVIISRKFSDGGIDLTATKDLANFEQERYYIQARCYLPRSIISMKDLREFRGVIWRQNSKGIFITTAKFPRGAKEFAEEDKSMQIFLIDGKTFVQKCIEVGLGFVNKPSFDEGAIKRLTFAGQLQNRIPEQNTTTDEFEVNRKITANDIKCRMLIMPLEIRNKLSMDLSELSLIVNGKQYLFSIGRAVPTRLGHVTQMLKNEGLISRSNKPIPKEAVWRYSKGKIILEIKKE